MRNIRIALLVTAGAIQLAATPLLADDLPKRKSGLWEVKTSAPNVRDEARSIQMCVDQSSDDITGKAAKNMCSKTDVHRETGRVVIDSVCTFGRTTATTHSVITGDFDSLYKVETLSTYDPPMGAMKQSGATIDARWIGPCKPDQRPGDMILGNGTKININNTGPGAARGTIQPPRPTMQPPPATMQPPPATIQPPPAK